MVTHFKHFIHFIEYRSLVIAIKIDITIKKCVCVCVWTVNQQNYRIRGSENEFTSI